MTISPYLRMEGEEVVTPVVSVSGGQRLKEDDRDALGEDADDVPFRQLVGESSCRDTQKLS